MLTVTIIVLLLAIPLTSISAMTLTRFTVVSMLIAAYLAYNGISLSGALDPEMKLYSGMLHVSIITQYMEVLMLVLGAIILLPWAHTHDELAEMFLTPRNPVRPQIREYPLVIVFTTLGATLLMCSADLVSMYLAVELQSFGVYILSSLYRDSESATGAGLKYFLLGALASAIILLGSALVYGSTGFTNLNSIFGMLTVPTSDIYAGGIMLGFTFITIGLLFKIAAAPFHYWAPDVYDGTPTIVTTWLIIMPKLSIFVFLLGLYQGTAALPLGHVVSTSYDALLSMEPIVNLLLFCAFMSILIGSVLGLHETQFKRLMAFSTITHVGFMLIALGIAYSTSAATPGGLGGFYGIHAFLFYLVQYSITTLNIFLVVLAFGYVLTPYPLRNLIFNPDVVDLYDLKGQFRNNPALALSIAVCLFSIAGIPPLVGFFAKYTVLYTAVCHGFEWLAIVGIFASVISGGYYLWVIAVLYFELPTPRDDSMIPPMFNETMELLEYFILRDIPEESGITPVHSYMISVLTLLMVLFAVKPQILLNSIEIIAYSIYAF